MEITKLQRSMLEMIWLDSDFIPLQLVADTLNIRKNYQFISVPLVKNGYHSPELRELLPLSLLHHLLRVRIDQTIKRENL